MMRTNRSESRTNFWQLPGAMAPKDFVIRWAHLRIIKIWSLSGSDWGSECVPNGGLRRDTWLAAGM